MNWKFGSKWGEPVVLGAGLIHVAHAPEEKLVNAELAEAVVAVAVALAG